MKVEGNGSDEKARKEYSVTNETLPAIIAGLKITAGDRVLTVGIDQAFSFLELAGDVTFVEIDPDYLEIIDARVTMLRAGDWQGFLSFGLPDETDDVFVRRRNDYFRQPGRLERIRERLDHLHITEAIDIVEYSAMNTGFSKIYLSNSVGGFNYSHPSDTVKALTTVATSLKDFGLIYVTAHYPEWEDRLPATLHLDEELSREAKALEQTQFWNPRVYHKKLDKVNLE